MIRKEIRNLIERSAFDDLTEKERAKIIDLILDMISRIKKNLEKGVLEKEVIEHIKMILKEKGLLVQEKTTFILPKKNITITRAMLSKGIPDKIIKKIVKGMESFSKNDLKFLKIIAKKIVNKQILSQEEISLLKDIVLGNSFWRFIN